MGKSRRPEIRGDNIVSPENSVKNSSLETDRRHTQARRRALQSLAAGGTAITVKALPERWAKPVLDTTIVPAHAQCSVAASLACEIDQPFSDELTSINLIPPRNPPGPWLTGGVSGTIDNLDNSAATPVAGSTVNFTFNHIAATVTPGSAGPIALNVNADVGANGGMASVNQGASQTIQPNDAGFVSFDEMGQDVVVGFSTDNPGSPEATATVHFRFSACEQDCVIDVIFSERFVSPPP